jgi:hypothetical protein
MMKKILVIGLLMTSSLFAEQYVMVLDKTNYINSIQIKCEEGFVISQETSKCVEDAPACELPLVLNSAKDNCVNSTELVNWIYTDGDTCNGMRQSNFDSNVYFARSRSSTTPSGNLEIPTGYHWVSKSEYISLYNNSVVANKATGIFPYTYHCGLASSPSGIEGYVQSVFLYNGGGTTGMANGNYEKHGATHQSYSAGSTGFSGYILYKEF